MLEQFPAVLPRELQAWVQEHHPGSMEEAVTVVEDLKHELSEPGIWLKGGSRHLILSYHLNNP